MRTTLRACSASTSRSSRSATAATSSPRSARPAGMGVLGALAFTPEQLEIELNWIDEHVDGKPYGVDVVMPASATRARGDLDPEHMAEQLEEHDPAGAQATSIEKVLDEHDVPPLPDDDERPRGLLGWTHEGARPQVDIALAHPIKLLVERARAAAEGRRRPRPRARREGRGARRLACSRRERQVNQGVDIIVAQGHEAGGHTGDVAHDGARARGGRRGRAGAGARRRRHRQRPADGGGAGARRARACGPARSGSPSPRATSQPIVMEKLLARGVARHRALALLTRQAGAPAAHGVDRRVGGDRLARATCRCRCSTCSTAEAQRRIATRAEQRARGHPRRPDRRHA